MPPITLPPDLEAWAKAKVAANDVASVEALVTETLRQRRALEEFRASLDAAEAVGREQGGAPADEFHARVRAQLLAD